MRIATYILLFTTITVSFLEEANAWTKKVNTNPMGDRYEFVHIEEISQKGMKTWLLSDCSYQQMIVDGLLNHFKEDKYRYRFDKEKPDFANPEFSDVEAFHFKYSLVSRMKKHESLIVEFYTYDKKRDFVTYSLTDFTSAYNQLKC